MTSTKAIAFESGDALNKEIKAIGTAAKKLDDRVQAAGVSAIWHFGVRTNSKGELIGDVGFINRLYKSLGKGARHVAFTEWVTQFGGVSANTGADKADNPFPWMAEMIDLKKEKNFFETRVTEYKTGGTLDW